MATGASRMMHRPWCRAYRACRPRRSHGQSAAANSPAFIARWLMVWPLRLAGRRTGRGQSCDWSEAATSRSWPRLAASSASLRSWLTRLRSRALRGPCSPRRGAPRSRGVRSHQWPAVPLLSDPRRGAPVWSARPGRASQAASRPHPRCPRDARPPSLRAPRSHLSGRVTSRPARPVRVSSAAPRLPWRGAARSSPLRARRGVSRRSWPGSPAWRLSACRSGGLPSARSRGLHYRCRSCRYRARVASTRHAPWLAMGFGARRPRGGAHGPRVRCSGLPRWAPS